MRFGMTFYRALFQHAKQTVPASVQCKFHVYGRVKTQCVGCALQYIYIRVYVLYQMSAKI